MRDHHTCAFAALFTEGGEVKLTRCHWTDREAKTIDFNDVPENRKAAFLQAVRDWLEQVDP